MSLSDHLPSDERCEVLRNLYEKHVVHPNGHWKGQAVACVLDELVSDVREALDFTGSIVDLEYQIGDGITLLGSAGYWAHGF